MERGKLAAAQDCLQHAHQLAPNEDYILRHLKIVQTRITNLRQTDGMNKQKSIAFAAYDPNDFGGGERVLDDSKVSDSLCQPSMDTTAEGADDVGNMPSAIKETKKTSRTNIGCKQHEKLQKPKQLIVDHQYQQTTTKGMLDIEQPIFLDASKSSSKIQEEYRASNSGQNGVNRRRYQQQTHLTSGGGYNAGISGNHDKPVFAHDLDDPSSGMS